MDENADPFGSAPADTAPRKRTPSVLLGCLAATALAVVGLAAGATCAAFSSRQAAPRPVAVRESTPIPTEASSFQEETATTAPAETATPVPAGATETAAVIPAVETATPAPAATLESGGVRTYYSIVDWPGPPLEAGSVTVPPATANADEAAQADQWYLKGKAVFDDNRWQDAIDDFDVALGLNPRHAEAYNYRGGAYRHVGPQNILEVHLQNYELALMDYTRAIVSDPAWWRPYRNRGYVYATRARLEPMRENRREWLKLALAEYTRAVELEGTRGESNCGRAEVHASLGELDVSLQEALLCPCDTTGCLAAIAAAYRRTGQCDEALQVAGQWEAADPGDPGLFWERGRIYLCLGEYDKAQRELEAAESMWGGDFAPGQLWFDRAAAEYYLGHYGKVKEYVATGLRYTWIYWGSPYYYLGMVYIKEGNVEEGVAALQSAEATLDDGDPLLQAARQELQRLGY